MVDVVFTPINSFISWLNEHELSTDDIAEITSKWTEHPSFNNSAVTDFVEAALTSPNDNHLELLDNLSLSTPSISLHSCLRKHNVIAVLTASIQVKPMPAAIRLLLYVLRSSQQLKTEEHQLLDESFLEVLFSYIEQTCERNQEDEEAGIATMKLVLSIHELCVIQKLEPNKVLSYIEKHPETGSSFGSSLIFLLNRSGDPVTQTMALKCIYMISSKKETSRYFYTNDLHVLIDIVLRAILDLNDFDVLRHAFLRVLHVLMTKTQHVETRYKWSELERALQQLYSSQQRIFGNSLTEDQRNIIKTTTSLVNRALTSFQNKSS